MPTSGTNNHDLRHSFASRALALGESLSMFGELLGHRRLQTTARYAHLALDSVKVFREPGGGQHRVGSPRQRRRPRPLKMSP